MVYQDRIIYCYHKLFHLLMFGKYLISFQAFLQTFAAQKHLQLFLILFFPIKE